MQIARRRGAADRQDAEGRGRPEEGHAVDALRARSCWPWCRRTASRSSRSGCPARCANPGAWFTLQMMLFLTTGALFVMWLGEQITERGLGNGASLLIFFSIVAGLLAGDLPDVPVRSARARSRSSRCSALRRDDDRRWWPASWRSRSRRAASLIQIPQRTMGAWPHARGGAELHSAAHQHGRRHADHLRAVGDRRAGRDRASSAATRALQRDRRAVRRRATRGCTSSLSAVLIIFFTYFYTSIIFNPVDMAENLKKQGGFIPGVKPGAKTAEYIEQVVDAHHAPGRDLPDGHRAAADADRATGSTCRSSSAARRC